MGVNLSGGQRIRIALARAFYKDCDILLLDDFMSYMDAVTAKTIIKQGLKEF